ncbi:MAG: DUF5688 family protein [Lachnospiraceae bacterium]
MDYQEFLEEVRSEAERQLGKSCRAAIHRVVKNNAVSMEGLVVAEEERNVSPTIYLEPFYEKFMQGEPFDALMEEILKVYRESRLEEDVDISFFTDYEQARELLFCKLVNYRSNEKLLALVPHKRFLDLAIVPYCLLKNSEVGSVSILVHHSHVIMWEREEADLMREAEKNTREAMGFEITTLKEVVEELYGSESDSIEAEDEIEMYVLSNKYKLNGAVCMSYEDVLIAFSEHVESDLYILPSSVHEVLLVPASCTHSLDRLSEMVREVNTAQIEREDILSDHAYLYRKNGGFEKADTFVTNL